MTVVTKKDFRFREGGQLATGKALLFETDDLLTPEGGKIVIVGIYPKPASWFLHLDTFYLFTIIDNRVEILATSRTAASMFKTILPLACQYDTEGMQKMMRASGKLNLRKLFFNEDGGVHISAYERMLPAAIRILEIECLKTCWQ